MSAALKPLVLAGFCILALGACDSKQAPNETLAKVKIPAEPTLPKPVAPVESFVLDTAVKQTDTLESLQKLYGQANVVKGELPGAEGETSQGWIIHPNSPEKKLMVYLDESNLHPGSIVVDETDSKWQLSNAIKLGTDSKSLQSINQKPFAFYGFGWDYGGVISDWNKGELDNRTANGSHLGIHLCPPENPQLPDNYLLGDGTFKSDNPLALEFPPIVCKISLSFPQPQ